MTGFLDYFIGTARFVPHGYCLLWRPDLVAMHGIGDGAIAISYFVITAVLLKARQFMVDDEQRLLALVFSLFIGFCAITHMVGVVTIWKPIYGMEGMLKLITAVISIGAAMIIVAIGPSLKEALRLNSENQRLRQEVARAEAAEVRLREREADLRSALVQARAASASKSDFLAAMSHDLRTPLNAIIGFSGGMLEGHLTGTPDENQARYLTHIHNSGHRLLSMVDEILDLARVSNGGLKPELKEIDIAETLRIPVQEVTQTARARRVDVRFEDETGGTRALADAGMVQRIATNLLGNAVRHAPEGGEARIICAIQGDALSIIVEDNGPGFPPERIEELRQPFATLESAPSGHGLGLAIVDGLCHAAGGTLLIGNREGGGARVEARLPLDQGSAREQETAA